MKNRGFTLLEMMVVLAIISIIVGIGYPNIMDSLQKSRRSDGKTALMGLQIAQEKLRANCNVYATTLDGAVNNCVPGDAAATKLKFPSTSDESFYKITITNASSTTYTATAKAIASGRQARDNDCIELIFTVDTSSPNGIKSSKDKDGNPSTGCW